MCLKTLQQVLADYCEAVETEETELIRSAFYAGAAAFIMLAGEIYEGGYSEQAEDALCQALADEVFMYASGQLS